MTHASRIQLVAAVAILAGGLVAAQPVQADETEKTGTLRVAAVDFNSDSGQAVISLYRKGRSWLSVGGAFASQKVAIKDKKASATFRKVPWDEYGVAVVHDTNGNGKLDMAYLPYPHPEEGGGVSNNWVRDGKPEYDKARFDFARSLMSVRILMRY